MTNEPSQTSSSRRNPLLMPLVGVSILALVEAVVLAAVLSRGPAGGRVADAGSGVTAQAATGATTQPAAAAPANVTPTASPADAAANAGAATGKRGQRVDSGGFGVTVEEISDEPTLKGMARVGPEERYLALLIAADNKTGGNADVYPSQFRLQDARGFAYDPLNLKVKMPTLEWRTLANRETVRGYVDFVVPRSAKGLSLIYTGTGSRPIRIELGA
jgi:hypothetical protein